MENNTLLNPNDFESVIFYDVNLVNSQTGKSLHVVISIANNLILDQAKLEAIFNDDVTITYKAGERCIKGTVKKEYETFILGLVSLQ